MKPHIQSRNRQEQHFQLLPSHAIVADCRYNYATASFDFILLFPLFSTIWNHQMFKLIWWAVWIQAQVQDPWHSQGVSSEHCKAKLEHRSRTQLSEKRTQAHFTEIQRQWGVRHGKEERRAQAEAKCQERPRCRKEGRVVAMKSQHQWCTRQAEERLAIIFTCLELC